MTTYNCVVKIETVQILDAENLKDMYKKVKEIWKDLHDINLADSEITIYKEVGIRYEDKYGVKNVPYRQFDEIKQEKKI
jgi:hypothetical protein